MASRSHLTYSSVIVLQAVAHGYRYGFDIMDASGLPGGTVYPALRRLEQTRYVRSKWEPESVARKQKRPRRRYYEVTSSGSTALTEALKRFRLLQHPLTAAPPDTATGTKQA